MFSSRESLPRDNLVRECRGLARFPLDLDPEEFEATRPQIQGKTIYEQMGNFAFDRFVETHVREVVGSKRVQRELNSGKVKTGFCVPARIIGQAPARYLEYRGKTQAPEEVDELAEALKRSTEVPLTLMHMPNLINNRVETRFGLRKDVPAKANGFTFRDSEEGAVLALIPEELEIAQTTPAINEQIVAAKSGYLPPEEEYCPARGFGVSKVWPALIDLAASVPDAFENDLKQ